MLVTRCTWLDMVRPGVYWSLAIFAVSGQPAFEAWSAEARLGGVHSGSMMAVDACPDTGLDEVARSGPLNSTGLTARRFALP